MFQLDENNKFKKKADLFYFLILILSGMKEIDCWFFNMRDGMSSRTGWRLKQFKSIFLMINKLGEHLYWFCHSSSTLKVCLIKIKRGADQYGTQVLLK